MTSARRKHSSNPATTAQQNHSSSAPSPASAVVAVLPSAGDDIIADTLARVRAVVDTLGPDALLDPSRWVALDEDARANWGGDRPYIAKSGEVAKARMSERNAAIRRDHQRGERVALLARRYHLSEVRIKAIVYGVV